MLARVMQARANAWQGELPRGPVQGRVIYLLDTSIVIEYLRNRPPIH